MRISDGKIFLRQAQFKVLNIGQHNVYDYLKEDKEQKQVFGGSVMYFFLALFISFWFNLLFRKNKW